MLLPGPLRRWRISSSPSPTPASPNPLKRVARLATKSTKWAAAQQERADKLLGDLQALNEGLSFLSGRMAGPAGQSVLPSRMLPHLWDDRNLQTFIEATVQHEHELAVCAEFKRDVLTATRTAADLENLPLSQAVGACHSGFRPPTFPHGA